MSRSTFKINGTDRTVVVTDEFAARFGGMTKVTEVASAPRKPASRAKTSTQTNSPKEGK